MLVLDHSDWMYLNILSTNNSVKNIETGCIIQIRTNILKHFNRSFEAVLRFNFKVLHSHGKILINLH